MKPIGLLGGTFDPVHNGHLRLALEVREHLQLDEVRLMPAPNPRLRKTPGRDFQTRLELLNTAIDGIDGLKVDDRESRQGQPTRSLETLQNLREEFPDTPLCLILGADIAARLDQWYGWQRLANYAHLVFARRPGSVFPEQGPVHELIAERITHSPAALHEHSAGRILICDIPGLDIQARDIRTRLAAGRSIDFLVPEKVKQMILNGYLHSHE